MPTFERKPLIVQVFLESVWIPQEARPNNARRHSASSYVLLAHPSHFAIKVFPYMGYIGGVEYFSLISTLPSGTAANSGTRHKLITRFNTGLHAVIVHIHTSALESSQLTLMWGAGVIR